MRKYKKFSPRPSGSLSARRTRFDLLNSRIAIAGGFLSSTYAAGWATGTCRPPPVTVRFRPVPGSHGEGEKNDKIEIFAK